MTLTDYHAKYLACEFTRRYASDDPEEFAVAGAQVGLDKTRAVPGEGQQSLGL